MDCVIEMEEVKRKTTKEEIKPMNMEGHLIDFDLSKVPKLVWPLIFEKMDLQTYCRLRLNSSLVNNSLGSFRLKKKAHFITYKENDPRYNTMMVQCDWPIGRSIPFHVPNVHFKTDEIFLRNYMQFDEIQNNEKRNNTIIEVDRLNYNNELSHGKMLQLIEKFNPRHLNTNYISLWLAVWTHRRIMENGISFICTRPISDAGFLLNLYCTHIDVAFDTNAARQVNRFLQQWIAGQRNFTSLTVRCNQTIDEPLEVVEDFESEFIYSKSEHKSSFLANIDENLAFPTTVFSIERSEGKEKRMIVIGEKRIDVHPVQDPRESIIDALDGLRYLLLKKKCRCGQSCDLVRIERLTRPFRAIRKKKYLSFILIILLYVLSALIFFFFFSSNYLLVIVSQVIVFLAYNFIAQLPIIYAMHTTDLAEAILELFV